MITLTVTDVQTCALQISDTANISDPNVSATGGNVFNLTEGSATLTNAVVASFTDSGNPSGTTEDASDYSATINWGDGSSGPGTIINNGDGTWSVTGSHSYVGDSVN